jgi:hypothetical protein
LWTSILQKYAKLCWRLMNMEEIRAELVNCQSGVKTINKIWGLDKNIQLIVVVFLWRWWSAKKTRPTGGRNPRHYIREDLSRRLRKPPNFCPTLTRGCRYSCECGPVPSLCALAWRQTRGFFNPSLKFAPTRSRTQDLRSATEAT